MLSAVKKPSGGLRSVTFTLLGSMTPLPIPIVEDRSSYTEELISDEGILRVHHTLTLTVPRTEAAALLVHAPQMLSHGVMASIITEAGEDLTAGWSDRFIHEQPLRLVSMLLGTGSRPAERNEAVLRFESDDTAALLEN